MPFNSNQWHACLYVVAVCLSGCGDNRPDTGTVSGVVTLDGKPLSHGSIISYPESGRGAVGEIQSDGTFHLGTMDQGREVNVGKHVLTVMAYDEAYDPNIEYDVIPKLIVPKRYRDRESSDLSVTVQAGEESVVELHLTSD